MSFFQTTYNPLTKVWSGRLLAPTYHPNVNAAQVLLDSMNRNPEKIGQINVNNGLKLTNRNLAINTIRFAQNLNNLGISNGDVVAVLAANHHHLSSVLFGAMALAAPVNILGLNCSTGKYCLLIESINSLHLFITEEITHMLGLTKPKIVFCEPSNIDRVRLALQELLLDIPVYTFDESPKDGSVDELLVETGNEKDFM